MKQSNVRISKFLSLVLRHRPEEIGLTLSNDGWVAVADLLAACARHNFPLTADILAEVVRTNDKQRFAFNDDHSMIRASQGHSVEVDLQLESLLPPLMLYHGTAERFLSSIREKGLIKGQRHHVHLSENVKTVVEVGSRYGRPVVLKIASGRMNEDGHFFFRSANGVWLTQHVPVNYIEFPNEKVDR